MDIAAQEQVNFLLFIQRILQEGQFSSTYKFALLQAIANVCVESPDVESEFDAHKLAVQFIQVYWRQTLPFRGVQLKQNLGQQAAVIKLIENAAIISGGSLARFRANEFQWNTLVHRVAGVIVEMPLWKLQNINGQTIEYLYVRGVNRSNIVLRHGIAFCFRRFYGLVTELVQSAWISFIRRHSANRDVIGADGELHEFLFGADRSALQKFKPILIDYQSGNCFYCRGALPMTNAQVDHFIPWSRYNSDLGHNFVLAHASCNRDKLDRLVGVEHLERWTERNAVHGQSLGSAFKEEGLLFDLESTNRIAHFAYEQAEAIGAHVWEKRPGILVPLDTAWRSILTTIPN